MRRHDYKEVFGIICTERQLMAWREIESLRERTQEVEKTHLGEWENHMQGTAEGRAAGEKDFRASELAE